jgi:hypothetical protein
MLDIQLLGKNSNDRAMASMVPTLEKAVFKTPLHCFGWRNAACGWAPFTSSLPVELDLDRAFDATFETRLYDYWYLELPADPDYRYNRWYFQDSPCTRGCFLSEATAHSWAREHLNGGPYELKFSEFQG